MNTSGWNRQLPIFNLVLTYKTVIMYLYVHNYWPHFTVGRTEAQWDKITSPMLHSSNTQDPKAHSQYTILPLNLLLPTFLLCTELVLSADLYSGNSHWHYILLITRLSSPFFHEVFLTNPKLSWSQPLPGIQDITLGAALSYDLCALYSFFLYPWVILLKLNCVLGKAKKL